MSQDESTVVVILFAGCRNRAADEPVLLKKIATLPAALRTMLSAAKAGVTRFLVVADPLWSSQVKQALEETGRVPGGVNWIEAPADDCCLAAILREILQRSPDRLVLAAGDRVFHPSLVRRAAEWTGTGLLALMGGNQLAGIYALSGNLLREIIGSVPREIESLDELCYWLAAYNCVSFETIDQNLWQAVHKPEDLSEAERKLNHWLYKKTDGIFARLNRKISIPISRQLIRISVTPNMVTIATLGVSALSGVFFALGGYLHALTGAVLSWAASVLDGCDGEVARLTHQESDFGCWLETLCDYLYYLFVFTGMTIGLWRSTGARIYLALGGLLLLGALLSMFATGRQRRRLDRPDRYLAAWQAHAEHRKQDYLMWFGRNAEFIIRRSFLPYAILLFALLDLTHVAFILCAFGAHLVWIVTLYSNRFFSRESAAFGVARHSGR